MPPVSIEGKQFRSIEMLDSLVDTLESVLNGLKPQEDDNKYVVFAVRDLAWISLSIISAVARQLHWRYSAYTAATMTRVLMECVTEMKYVKSHPKKAKKFWMSQEKIRLAIKNASSEDERWQLFTSDTLSKIGQLSDSTAERVKNMLGNEDLGRYNLFCFYSHPNIAGYGWVSRDASQPGAVVRFAAETSFKMIDDMLTTLGTLESQHLDVTTVRADLEQTYKQYIQECEDQ